MNTLAETAAEPTRDDLLALLAERDRELAQARARDAATAEILGAIARSPSDVQPVFEAILAACQRLFGSDEMGIYTVGDDALVRVAAWRGPRGAEVSGDVTPLAESVTGRLIAERRTHHIPDLRADPTLSQRVRERVERLGSASLLYAPMLSGDHGLGSILVVRAPPSPFSEREAALLQSFADQAAVAIENTRLFHETKEALEAQTATADILKVTAASPQDTQPVFDAIAASAKRLLHGHTGVVFRYAGGMLHVLAHTPVSPEADAAFEADYPRPLDAESLQPGEVVEIADTEAVESLRDLARARGYRSVARAPLISDGEIIGFVAVTRKQAGALPRRHVHLLQTFADQAVIAIRNVQLFNETQQALERQTASADILRVISRSPTDPRPVFDNIVVTAVRLLRASLAAVHLREGDQFYPKTEATPEGLRAPILGKSPIDPNANFPSRAILGRQTLYVPDWSTAELPDDERVVREALGVNCGLYLPLLREGECFGLLSVFAQAPDSFGPAELTLAESFRDQALIAVENARLFNETQEALQQQTATADVLKVISRSVFDLDTVLETLIDTAVRLARGSRGTIFLKQGDVLVARAFHRNVPDPIRAYLTTTTWPLDGDSQMAQAVREGRVVHIADLARSQLESDKATRARAAFGAGLWVPLMRDRQAIGVFGVPRDEPIAFSDREIELVQTFADQAVIAIENTRLFDEVQARTRDLSEALVYQTGSANILKVIASSPTDVAPALRAIVDSACEVCGAYDAAVNLREGDFVRFSAHRGPIPLGVEGRPLDRGWVGGRAILDRAPVHVPDLQLAGDEFPQGQEMALRMGHRAILAVPLLREGDSVGAIVVRRNEAQPFTDKQIEILHSFADQAVIAIENARLFEQLQAKTRDLEESLRQQTATADVLKVISRSAFDLQTVLDTLVASAQRLCDAQGSMIFVRDGEVYRIAACIGMPEAFVSFRLANPLRADRLTAVGRVALSGEMVHLADVMADADIQRAGPQLGGFRAVLSVPLVRDNEVVGIFALNRPEPGPFSPGQVKLVQTFADQAAIAIANVRLFDEIKSKTDDLSEALQQQTATADVLKAISRTAFDLDTVLVTLISTAVRLCNASHGQIFRRHDDVYRYAASQMEVDPAYREHEQKVEIRPGRGTLIGRVALENRAVSIADAWNDWEYEEKESAKLGNVRAMLGVPLMRGGESIGAFALARSVPIAFTARQIELVTTFADQAVIAIENVRLFDEVQARTRELAASLDDLRKTQDRLIQSEKLASLGQLTAGIAHEIKNPLNFVNNFSSLSRELLEELRDALDRARLDDDQRDEVAEVIAMLDGNLEKVVNHGKRADSIVKNMLLHSREGSGERTSVDINAMVEEALNLAYHGARAENRGFNVKIEKAFDARAGFADLYAQEMTRVLLNLMANALYATHKRKETETGAYEPTIRASTEDLGERVAILIRDNGTGVSQEVKAKMFNPFFTTKPAGEGTGLGLSLSHDIVVKQHAGALQVESQAGAYTQFTILLPRAGHST